MCVNLQPKVAVGQQLIRVETRTTLQPMVVSDQKIRDGFAQRLASALRDSAGVPDDPRKWRPWLSSRYGVSQEAARKWLAGLAVPEMTKIVAIALDLDRSVEFLLTGRTAGAPPQMPALSKVEEVILGQYRAAPAYGQAIMRTVADTVADSAGKPARTLHIVAEQGAPYPGLPPAAGRGMDDADLLAFVIEQAETLPKYSKLSAAQRGALIAKAYQGLAADVRKPTAARVLRLLRSA